MCLPDLSWLFPLPRVSEWPIEYVKIKKVNYQRNSNASFCKRPPEMIDTIVLHHSETPSTDTPQRINDYHLARGSKDDPWYMIGYSYVVNAPYPGATRPSLQVSEGRPLDIVGAHAGSHAWVSMSEEQKKLWDQGKINCGKENGEFKVDNQMVNGNKIKANITTIGMVVVGNYAPYDDVFNPNGYPANRPRKPTKSTLDIVARTACQLQKKYPNMKNIKWHSYYNATTCPGDIKNHIDDIKTLARNYGCEFY